MKKTKKILLLSFFLFTAFFSLSGQKQKFNSQSSHTQNFQIQDIQNLTKYVLNNGLELYVLENHSIPLVYMDIAVRYGNPDSESSNKSDDESMEIMHFFEKMIFKGNSKFSNAEEISKKLSELGIKETASHTDNESVCFSVTIPSDKLEETIEFWNYAIRFPKLNRREFENQKKALLSELAENSKAKKAEIFYTSKLFSENSYLNNYDKSKAIIEKASVKQLKNIQKEYFIPNNTAFFIGGDLLPEEAFNLVNKYLGGWKKSKSPWKTTEPRNTTTPLTQNEFYVIPSSEVSEQTAELNIYTRGPDSDFTEPDLHTADLLFTILENPQGHFSKTFLNDERLAIFDSKAIKITYKNSRHYGLINISTDFLVPEQYLPQRVQLFCELLRPEIKNTIQNESQSFTKELETAKKRIMNLQKFQNQSPKTLIENLKDSWCSASSDYYINHVQKIQNIEIPELKFFADTYLANENFIVIVTVNPQIYELQKETFREEGFILLQ